MSIVLASKRVQTDTRPPYHSSAPSIPELVRLPIGGLIKRQRAPVYPVEGVLLAEIRGKEDRLYAVGRYEIILFLTA